MTARSRGGWLHLHPRARLVWYAALPFDFGAVDFVFQAASCWVHGQLGHERVFASQDERPLAGSGLHQTTGDE